MKSWKAGVISPASNVLKVFPNRREVGIKNLEELGMKVVFTKNAIRYNNSSKQSVKERIEEINEMISLSPDIIFSSLGGYTSIQILDKINYSKIKENNIVFCGFSDITALLLAIYKKTKQEVLYGPVYTVNLCDYGGVDSYTKDSLLSVLEGKRVEVKPSTYAITEFIDWKDLEEKEIIKKQTKKENDWKIIKEGKVQGKLIGGNLTTILLILGTKYLNKNDFKDTILFLEDCETNIDEFCSYLESLRLKGVLKNVKGILFGKFDSKEMNDKIEEFLKDYFEDYKIPIICNLDFGHVFPIMTLPIGREAILECKKETIHLELLEKNMGE